MPQTSKFAQGIHSEPADVRRENLTKEFRGRPWSRNFSFNFLQKILGQGCGIGFGAKLYAPQGFPTAPAREFWVTPCIFTIVFIFPKILSRVEYRSTFVSSTKTKRNVTSLSASLQFSLLLFIEAIFIDDLPTVITHAMRCVWI